MMKCLLILLVLLLGPISQVLSESSNQCGSGRVYSCPNCGGIEVENCLDCDGYLSTDDSHSICFDRRLFRAKNTEKTDHDDHYHYLWNDIVAAVVWLFMSGIATACGVGGGGMCGLSFLAVVS